MKFRLRLLALVCVAASIITSCKKSVNEKEEERNSLALATSSGNNCRSIGLGLAANQGNPKWENLMLKWFDSEGKIDHLKAVIYHYYQSPTANIKALDLDYGEVTYANDEVHVRDVLYNDEVLKVKLDAQKRPMISWFDHHGRSYSTFRFDTSYYFYNSDNQLESMIVHRSDPTGAGFGIFNMQFHYDPAGNLVLADVPDGTYEFRYDYTRTNTGMVSSYLITTPIKLLEYLDLLKLNHHHHLQNVLWRANGGYPVLGWTYSNIETNPFGKVTRYDGTDFSPIVTYYTAWDCNGTNLIQSRNLTQSEFMKLIK